MVGKPEAHLGQVLGAQTGGGTGYPLWFELPWNFGDFRFSILRGYSNHDRYLEGVGTIPDVPLTNTVKAIHQQTDGILMSAYEHVVRFLGRNQPMTQLDKGMIKQHFAVKPKPIVPYFEEEAYWHSVQKD